MALFYNRLKVLHDEFEKEQINFDEYFCSVILLEKLHFEKKNGYICKEIKKNKSLSFQLLPFEINPNEYIKKREG